MTSSRAPAPSPPAPVVVSRIVQTGDTPAKRRNAHLRSCAEVVRLLAQRSDFADEESRDMVAFLVINLRGIVQTIEISADAWDDRDYYKKSEALRQRWRWARTLSADLERLVRTSRWNDLPPSLIELSGHLQDIDVASITRSSDWWGGAYRALLREKPDSTNG